VNHRGNNQTPLLASLLLTGFASTGTSVIWNGLPFIAKRDYSFSETQNLALYLLIGLLYVPGALSSGKVIRFIEQYVSTRSFLAVILSIETVVCLLPLFFSGPWVIWVAGGVAGFCSAWLWPIVESYLVAGRHGADMRRVIGWWNIVWMVAVAAVMFAMAPLMTSHASMVIVGLGAMNLCALFVLPWYRKNPSAHEVSKAKQHVPRVYKDLLCGTRVLLPLSYVINGVFAPLLPFVLSGLLVDIAWQTPLAAVWMLARVGATGWMWKTGGWHGRWSVLWFAIGSMALGFVLILSAPNLAILAFGLALFGIGMGVTYYAALYYAMAVGNAEVDAAGKHEALIGSGYMIGPIIGLVTIQVADSSQVHSFQTLIYAILFLIALSIGALAVFGKKAR